MLMLTRDKPPTQDAMPITHHTGTFHAQNSRFVLPQKKDNGIYAPFKKLIRFAVNERRPHHS